MHRHAEGLDDRLVLVGDERKGEVVLFLESFLRGHIVGADTDDSHPLVGEVLVGVAQAATLGGAAGRVGLGEEINEGVALLVDGAEVERVAGFGDTGDGGGRRADGQWLGPNGGEQGEEAHGGEQTKESAHAEAIIGKGGFANEDGGHEQPVPARLAAYAGPFNRATRAGSSCSVASWKNRFAAEAGGGGAACSACQSR